MSDRTPPGMVKPGNIDLGARPMVKGADGAVSTVRSMSVNLDGVEVLLPTVSDDGRLMDEDEAIEEYRKTGQHLGVFASPELATQYAKQLHQDQEQHYLGAARQDTTMNEIDEYTQAWGDGAIVPPAELTVQGEARKKAKQDQEDFESEFADLMAQEGKAAQEEGVIGDDAD